MPDKADNKALPKVTRKRRGNPNIKNIGVGTRFTPENHPISPGRPRTKPFKKMLLKLLEEQPDDLRQMLERAILEAKGGQVQFFKELRDMLDGKPALSLQVSETEPTQDNGDDLAKLFAELDGE